MNFAKQTVAAREGWSPDHANAVAREFAKFMQLAAIDKLYVSASGFVKLTPHYLDSPVGCLWHRISQQKSLPLR